MLQKENKQELYISPEVEVLETQMQAVICQSGPNVTDSYDREIW